MYVDVTARGPVPESLMDAAREKVEALDGFVSGSLMSGRVVLTQERNPRLARPARAEGEVILAGQPIRARAEAAAMRAAIDELGDQLREQLRRHVDRMITRGHRSPEVEPGEWRHAAWTPPRPPRPAPE
jgi:ribosome-associated translation inhibitor RaiA